jgi:Tfp pilus assembly protein PilV
MERTFSWFESYRRLSKDYEVDTESSQTMIYMTMIQIMINQSQANRGGSNEGGKPGTPAWNIKVVTECHSGRH